MNIDTATLAGEVERAMTDWPFIVVTERGYSLPRFLLFAVGSRETNLTNEVGDGGHGHGVWQLDDRSHTIPGRFDQNVGWQCNTAGGMLAGLIGTFAGNLRAAVAAYNSGAGTVSWNLANGFDVDRGTAGNDYSRDVLERMAWLQSNHTYPPPPGTPPAVTQGVVMQLIAQDPGTGGYWLLLPNGTKCSIPDTTSLKGYRAAGIKDVELSQAAVDQYHTFG